MKKLIEHKNIKRLTQILGEIFFQKIMRKVTKKCMYIFFAGKSYLKGKKDVN